MKKIICISVLICLSQFLFAQENLDIQRVNNFRSFCKYLKKTDSLKLDTFVLFHRYVDINYIKSDSSKVRIQKRLQYMVKLCRDVKSHVNMLWLKDYDATKLSNYHFKNAEETNGLKEIEDQVYVYFLKAKPETPLGYIRFAPQTNKVISWILINQGGYHYFLTLNMM